MKRHNTLAFSRKNGGGNFEGSELALGFYAILKGRLASFLGVLLAVLFVFSAPLVLSSCSSDDEAKDSPTTTDYQSLLTSHDWEITSANQRLGGILIDMKEADTYCHFSTDSIFFSEGEMVNSFDDEGKVTKSEYKFTSIGSLPYLIKGDKIQIDKQTFTITNNNQSTESSLAIANEDWELVLKNK